MKTIKQIREEYDNNFLSQVEMPEEIVLEGRESLSRQSTVPSAREMPAMLVFRRIQYRIFPNKQVVALYYSKMINKYLSIPYGPDGNVNLSEAMVVEDELLEDWKKVNRHDKTSGMSQKAVNAYRREHPGSKLQTAVTEKNPTGKRASRRKSFCSRMGGMKKRLTSAKTAHDPDSRINKALRRWRCEEAFKQKLEEKRMQHNEGLVDLATSAANLLGKGASFAFDAAKTVGKKLLNPLAGSKNLGQDKSAAANIKKGSTNPKSSAAMNPTASSKLNQANLAKAKTPLKENTINDLRTMIDCGGTLHEMKINGRTVQLNNTMAKRIVEVYDSVNSKNKKVVESMLNEDLESFKKLLNFSIKV